MGYRTDPKRQDLIGQQFGRLTVTKFAFIEDYGRGRAWWHCLCDCGNKKTVAARHLKSGASASCGCKFRESVARNGTINGKKNKRHGHKTEGKASPEYISWTAMWQRCTNPRFKNFDRYGGHGIFVCKRWKRFEYFLADMGPRPTGTTLDRINGEGNYKPSNCRWATRSEQNKNRRSFKINRKKKVKEKAT